jgi:hypothetical protein
MSRRIARPSDPDWTAWKKDPVSASTPAQPTVNVFPDPNVFWLADSWRMFVRAGYPDSGRGCPLPPLH